MKSAVCLIVRNEAPDVAEWLAFHHAAGFDSLIVFDNRSDDGTADLIRAAARHIDIRFHDWEDRTAESQVRAYAAACDAYRLEFDWIAFIDADEFFVTAGGEQVNPFLARFEGWSAIAINWAVYGSSGHVAPPPGLLIESFGHRAATDFFPARHVKTVLRPRHAVQCLNPHYFAMQEDIDGHYCDTHGRYMLWHRAPELPGGTARGVSRATPDYSACRINHYFTRSRAHWQAKLRRGYPADFVIRKEAEFTEYDRNEIADPIAARAAPTVRRLLQTWDLPPVMALLSA